MIKKLFILLLIVSLFCQKAFSQIEFEIGSIREGFSESWYNISLDQVLLKDLTSVVPKKDDSFQFAIPIPVNLTPSNSGTIVNENGENIWTLSVRSEGARSLNIILEPFILPEGAFVYIYDRSKTTIRGAFTSDNNLETNILPTMPVPGEELILECHFPESRQMTGAIGVTQIAHDYVGIMGTSPEKDGRFGLSQSCNVDINCNEGLSYNDEKRAVCRVLVNGTELCTGVMINNSSQLNIPYLLTAQHCIGSKSDASRTIFVFGYESSWCDGSDGRVSHSLSGATLKATNPDIDFTLVELSTFPPMVYKPFLAGWDVSGTIPVNSFSIHHPQGDVKKISIDNNPPVSTSYGNYAINGFWKILQWDTGTTEPGSSGCPLFDQNNRVTGLLTGGDAICGRPVNDYFAKLSKSYSLEIEPTMHLKSWIDPASTGVIVLNGRDPYSENYSTNDTLYNILDTETVSGTQYTLPGKGYFTGFNSDSIKGYAEYFRNTRSEEITEIWLNIIKANSVTLADSLRVYVYADGAVPGQVLASKKLFISEARDLLLLKIDFDKTVPVSGNFYIGWKIWYRAKALLETRQFAIYHSPDRFSASLNSAWYLKNGVWNQFLNHPFDPGSYSLDVKVILTGNSVVDDIVPFSETQKEFTIYPTPASNYVVISSESIHRNLKGEIFNLTGEKVIELDLDNIFPGSYTLNISSLNPGIYNLILSNGQKGESLRIMKIK